MRMRPVHYLALFFGVIAVQACGRDDHTPPPYETDGELSDRSEDDDYGDGDYGGDDSTYAGDEEIEGTEGEPLPQGPCTVSYEKEIYPKVQEQWRCGDSLCHGAASSTLRMDTTNPDATFALLTSHVHMGKKLVDVSATDPNASSLFCLMKGTCGKRMPYQGVSATDLAIVETWLRCSAKR